MAKIPEKYRYLREEPLPPLMVRVALDMLGTLETPGNADNPVILGWADEVAKLCKQQYDRWAADFYNDDSIPWCGLFCAVVASRASQGRPTRFPPRGYLAALSWRDWGQPGRIDNIEVGDVVVLKRAGGGHVFIAVGVSHDGESVFGVGGNQSDAVTIAEFATSRIVAVRRPPYENKPAGARFVQLGTTGQLSTREA
jgi:uncharacterized protein (TIGR02594 family)